LPTDDEIAALYTDNFYTSEKPDYFRLHDEDADWWRLAYRERIERIGELTPGRRILDIGCGWGGLLETARDLGWQIHGIDPAQQAEERCHERDIPFTRTSLEAGLPLGRFDAIHVSEVLEHIPDPARFLVGCREYLNPGGILCVVVPNDFNPWQKAVGGQHWVNVPHHVNYFDFDSLTRLVEGRAGFEIVDREATFPLELFLLWGDDYRGADATGRACHGRRKQFELALDKAGETPRRRSLYRALADHGLGREAIVYGRIMQPGS
jgi:SAM-dependent methyltransferase